jgi:hypothetical protein
MVTKFNTTAPAGTSTSGGSSKTLLIVLGLALAGFLVYRYVIKPRQEKKQEDKKDNKE